MLHGGVPQQGHHRVVCLQQTNLYAHKQVQLRSVEFVRQYVDLEEIMNCHCFKIVSSGVFCY